MLVGFGLHALDGSLGQIVFFGLVGLATAVGFVIHAKVKQRRKAWGHKISLAVIGLSLAFALKDNRAFCKILCPITVFLRVGARRSLLKVAGDAQHCTQCGACDKACPMDIPVSSFINAGKRVLSGECTLCQTCIASCAQRNLDLSLGLD